MARRVGLPFGGHVNGGSAMEVSDSGISVMDHVNTAADLDKRCMGPQASIEQCEPVAERLQSANTWWVPTLTRRLHFNRSAKPNPGVAADAVVTRFDEMVDQFWAGSPPQSGWLQGAVDVKSADSLRFFSIMQHVGLPILLGTDTDVGPDALWRMPPGFAVHMEMGVYVTEGLTPLAALQAATLNPAKMLRATDSLGTVAPGKLADLVLLDADPLTDITNTTTIRAVVANGRYFDRAVLDTLLAEVQKQAKAGFRYFWAGNSAREGMTVGKRP
jgi:imidazolonepropionase-like amidohydrolase